MNLRDSKEYEESRRMLVRAIASAKANEFGSAKRMLERILYLPARHDQRAEAYFWLSEITNDQEEKRENLELALAHNPVHHLARKKLAIISGKLKESEIIDPDKITPQQSDEPLKSEGKRFVCENCGGKLTYMPDGLSLACEYCASKKRTKILKSVDEEDFVVGISTSSGHLKAEAMQAFECSACGAIFIILPEVISLTCPHCDSAYSITKTISRQIVPPEGIIPFEISEDQVSRIILKWLKINNITKSPHIGKFTGVYLPIWTFDITGSIKWTGELYEENKPYKVSDQRGVFFDDILIPASNPLPYKFSEIIKDYDPASLVSFSPEYTVNWLAETYKITMGDAAIEARSVAYQKGKKNLIDMGNLKHLNNLQFFSAGLYIEAYKLILLSVWIGSYSFSGKEYPVTINGKTGILVGKTPPSTLKKISNWILDKE